MSRSPLRLALSAALLAGLALVVPAQAAPPPAGATWTEQWVSSADGTPLHADVLLPNLWPADWLLPKGHRLALQLAGDDMTMYQPTYTGSTVAVEGSLRLPLLTKLRTSNLVGEEASAQARVPTPTLGEQQLSGREVRADFGRPMRG